ncbi:hypothetical protein [Leptospira neocaledonica]|uniref:hypothetical protein n=1 Tax=Leptospira neocaledonica TaxID=2023192 RepID=UPI000F64856F|nr:hypothetical protein [Leptospira neocaledonica]
MVEKDNKNMEKLALYTTWRSIFEIPLSQHPEFYGTWQQSSTPNPCDPDTLTYEFNLSTYGTYRIITHDPSCIVSDVLINFEWKIDAGSFCQKYIPSSGPFNCYSYSINSTLLIVDGEGYNYTP